MVEGKVSVMGCYYARHLGSVALTNNLQLCRCSLTSYAAAQKEQKYASLTPLHCFVPVAVETLGPWNPEGLSFIRELGRRTSQVTGEPRETAFLLQRMSMAVQMGNAASFAGSLPLKGDRSRRFRHYLMLPVGHQLSGSDLLYCVWI